MDERDTWRKVGALKEMIAALHQDLHEERQIVRNKVAEELRKRAEKAEASLTDCRKDRDTWRERHARLEKRLAKVVETLKLDGE